MQQKLNSVQYHQRRPIRLSWDRSLGGGEATDISTILLPNAPVLLPLSLLIVAPGSKLHVLGFRCKVLLLFQVSCMRYLLREATDIFTILLPNAPVLLPLSLLIVTCYLVTSCSGFQVSGI